jgi:hypothetical protein
MRQRRHTTGAGYVYIVQDKTVTKYCKIGRTRNPERRLRDFEVKLPFELELLWLIPTDDANGLETRLHRQYAKKRIGGECFALTPADIDAIKHEYPS